MPDASRLVPAVSVLVFSMAGATRACAQQALRLCALFGDHMVLPQRCEVPVRGMAAPGSEVAVRVPWRDAELRARAGDDGRFAVAVPTPGAGGPFALTVQCGSETIALQDVLVGDVWLGSGQSNMEMPVGHAGGWQSGVANWQQELAAADLPRLRLFTVGRRRSDRPADDVQGTWQVCSPETARTFSAAAFFFGRDLQALRGEPLGLCTSSWGGTVAEAWTSAEGLRGFPEFAGEIEGLRAEGGAATAPGRWDAYWSVVDAAGPREGGRAPYETGCDDAGWSAVSLPHVWSQQGLRDFDGVGWYRTRVAVPAAWAGHDLVLMLGPIDDMDSVWFGGRKVAGTERPGHWQERREYRVPGDAVVAGEAVLAVRVVDTGGEGGVAGDPEGMRIQPAGGEAGALSLAGPWRFRRGPDLDALPRTPAAPGDANVPTVLWNGMIAPLAGFPFRGVLWYQGEANRERAAQYERLFPALIADWRRAFGAELPFLFVQIAPFAYEGDAGESFALRRAQAAALALPATGMVVTTDVGDAEDIHPRDKQAVGRRLCLQALAIAYGVAGTVADGPHVRRVTAAGRTLRIAFDGVEGGLRAGAGELPLEVAGPDGAFHAARGAIEGDVLVVACEAVAEPRQVRYCHAAAARGTLANARGLPAAPFLAAIE
jgi:sialate O-acetylesterase